MRNLTVCAFQYTRKAITKTCQKPVIIFWLIGNSRDQCCSVYVFCCNAATYLYGFFLKKGRKDIVYSCNACFAKFGKVL